MKHSATADLPAGFTSPEELAWLAERARGARLAIEIGTYAGRSAIVIARAMGGGKLYCVDRWRNKGRFRAVQKLAAGGVIVPMRARSVDAIGDLLLRHDATFDFAFIDGSHEYPDVRADITGCRALLRPGGFLCGHNFEQDHLGVINAVHHLVPGFHLGPGSLWYRP